MKTTVIYHSADFDGLFCREIARKFLPEAQLVGWDFGDPILPIDSETEYYVLDLPVDRPLGMTAEAVFHSLGWRLRWIDHHKSSIETHPKDTPGYRIDGVAACRLCWQWFCNSFNGYGTKRNFGEKSYICTLEKRHFVERLVMEPLAVRLAGEYDVFDKRDPNAALFQFGLKSDELNSPIWRKLLCQDANCGCEDTTERLLEQGRCLQYARSNEYRDVITQQGFDLEWEGLRWLCCNSHELDIRSQLFEGAIRPEHDGLLGFTFTGKDWRVSLYGVPGKEIDMSTIASKHGGGGHRGAAGFRCKGLPFPLIAP